MLKQDAPVVLIVIPQEKNKKKVTHRLSTFPHIYRTRVKKGGGKSPLGLISGTEESVFLLFFARPLLISYIPPPPFYTQSCAGGRRRREEGVTDVSTEIPP